MKFLILLVVVCISCGAREENDEMLLVQQYENMVNDVENRVYNYSCFTSSNEQGINYKLFTIAHCSDIHAGRKNWRENINEYIEFCSRPKIKNRINILLCTGDLCRGKGGRDRQKTLDEIMSVNYIFMNQDIPSYFVIGNHDDNINEAGYVNNNVYDSVIDKETQYNIIIKPHQDKWRYGKNGKCYYYNDFDNYGIRLICLDFVDYPIVESDIRHNALKYDIGYYFSQSQLEWFYETLKSVPKGYGAIIAIHGPLVKKLAIGSYSQGISLLTDVVNAYKNGAKFNHHWLDNACPELSTRLLFDFTMEGKKEFICWLTGHIHQRICTTADNYNDQLIISAPCLYTPNAINSKMFLGGQYAVLSRTDNLLEKNSFNILSINRIEKKLILTAFGAYLDIREGEVSYRTRIINYL